MDMTTQFIDTLGTMTHELEDIQKQMAKLNRELSAIIEILPKGDCSDHDTRTKKLDCVKVATEHMQNFVAKLIGSKVWHCVGSLEMLQTLLAEKDDETWYVMASHERLSAPQTVDKLTDAITEYLLENAKASPNPKAQFEDNPDAFVARFVANYLDHPVTDRMSDMVISLVTDWMSFRMA